MPAAGVVTLIGVFITVVALALYLITIAAILKHVNFTLGTIIAGVRSIANQTQPLGGVIGEIVGDVSRVDQAVRGLVARAQAPAAPRRSAPRAPSMTMMEEESEMGSEMMMEEPTTEMARPRTPRKARGSSTTRRGRR
ncbi:MAG: hypothetical protein ACRDJ4_02215 [Actinomycetota bacterium]